MRFVFIPTYPKGGFNIDASFFSESLDRVFLHLLKKYEFFSLNINLRYLPNGVRVADSLCYGFFSDDFVDMKCGREETFLGCLYCFDDCFDDYGLRRMLCEVFQQEVHDD